MKLSVAFGQTVDKFPQSHTVELFRFQFIPEELTPELKVSAAAHSRIYIVNCKHRRNDKKKEKSQRDSITGTDTNTANLSA
jgi:hypothetical protein